jgi:ketosteroid isomerase-like protein
MLTEPHRSKSAPDGILSSMSQENVAIVRRLSELMRASYAKGRAEEEALALCAPDMRIDASRRVFNPEVYVGPDGLQRMIAEVCDAWEGFEETNERMIDVGERVLVLQAIGGRGRTSGVEVRASGALIFTLRDGHVRSVEVFSDRREAIEAVGLAHDLAAELSAEPA